MVFQPDQLAVLEEGGLQTSATQSLTCGMEKGLYFGISELEMVEKIKL
jgi:hypothetical protein